MSNIHNSNQVYKFIFESSMEAILLTKPDGPILAANHAAEELFGYSKEEFLGLGRSDIVDMGDPKLPILLEERRRNGEVKSELTFIRKNGEKFPGFISSHIFKDENGHERTTMIIRDLTETKRAEKTIKESETYYRAIFEHTGTATIIIEEDTAISLANTEFEKLSGYSREELEGKKSWTDFAMKDLAKMKEYHTLRRTNPEAAPVNYEFKFIGREGSIKNIHLDIGMIPGTKKSVASLLDISHRKNAQEVLLSKEKELSSIYNNISEVLYSISVEGGDNYKFISVNQAFLDTTGLIEDQVVGKYVKEVIPEPSLKIVLDNYKKAINEKKTVRWEEITDYPTGKKYGNVSITPVFDARGQCKQLIGTVHDITDLKKAENDLFESEKRFRMLINNSTDLIRILDKEGKIIFDSPSSERILGYPEGFFIDKSPMEFIHPDDQDNVKNDLEEVYKNRNPGIPTEFRIRKADGSYLPVESVSQNMLNVSGINGIVVTTHPIKERKAMEDALRENEEKYRTLFEKSPNLAVLLGKNGVILDVNNATTKLAGLTKKDLIGKNFSNLEIMFSEDMDFHLDKINNLLNGENIEPFESQVIDKNGNIHLVLVHLTAVMKDEKIVYILGIGSDITEQKMAENEIRSSLKEKEILLTEIHHRVKNNMQIISSLLNLQKNYVEGTESLNILKESQNRVKSMAMIHEKLYKSNTLTHINIADYIQDLVSDLFYSYKAEEKMINRIIEIEDIEFNIETAIPCGLILNELISNCLKYSFPSGRTGEVYISLKLKDDNYELIVKDNGIGLPDDIDYKNTDSLGLQLVNSLIDQIDGEIELDRSHGTEFKITFRELEYTRRI